MHAHTPNPAKNAVKTDKTVVFGYVNRLKHIARLCDKRMMPYTLMLLYDLNTGASITATSNP